MIKRILALGGISIGLMLGHGDSDNSNFDAAQNALGRAGPARYLAAEPSDRHAVPAAGEVRRPPVDDR